jgi:PAS domain S-box-containing protein
MSEQEVTEDQIGSAGCDKGPFHFLDALPVGIFIALPGGVPYYANREAVRLLGRGVLTSATGPELNETYQAYLRGTDEIYPAERTPVVRGLAGETTYLDDMEIRRPDGTVVPIEVWGTPVVGPDGSVEHGISTFIDISERKRAEAGLASRRALLDLAHDAAFLSDTGARITYWTRAPSRCTGTHPRRRWGACPTNCSTQSFPSRSPTSRPRWLKRASGTVSSFNNAATDGPSWS